MTKDDAALIVQELEKNNVTCQTVGAPIMWAVIIYTDTTKSKKWCSVIASNGVVTWGPDWEHCRRVEYPELAVPNIVRTLPKSARRAPAKHK